MRASWRARKKRTRIEYDRVLISTNETLSVASSAMEK